jgi:hypothetical protein
MKQFFLLVAIIFVLIELGLYASKSLDYYQSIISTGCGLFLIILLYILTKNK